jgi:hypothetical protein
MTEKTYKILTKHTFIEAAIEGEKIGFNRALSPLALDDELPDDKVFPIIEVMHHEHIAGEPVELHYRVKVVLPSSETVLMDMTTATYHALPEVVVNHPDKEGDPA